MAKNVNALPKDFVLDEHPKAELPEGFELDSNQGETKSIEPQNDWDVLKGYAEKKQPREFMKKFNEMNKPQWDEKADRFIPDARHPETYWANGVLDIKDMTQGAATLLGKGLKSAFIDAPSELYNRAKNHKPLITGQDFSNAWETTKEVAPEVAKAMFNPYIEALKGNFVPMMQNPVTTTLDVLGVGELGKIAKVGRFKAAGKELAELASNPKKYVAKIKKPVELSEADKLPEGFEVDNVKPEINDLASERPLSLNEFTKIQNEKLNQFAPQSRINKLDKEAKVDFVKKLDELKTDVHKKEYITNSKQGNFWKTNISDPLELAIMEAEGTLNSTIEKIKKNPSVLKDQESFNAIDKNFNKVLEQLPDEARDDFYIKYYNAVDEAENFNKTGHFASIRLPQRYIDYYNEYLNLYNSQDTLAKATTQEYFQKYGQKLSNPNYPKHEPMDLTSEGLSSDELFAKIDANREKNPIFTVNEMDDKIGKIFNKHSKYSQARNLEIEKQINGIIGELTDVEKADLARYLQDPLSYKDASKAIKDAAIEIQDIVNVNTKSLIDGGYLSEETAINNPYKQAVVARWIENNKDNFTKAEFKQLAETGDLKTYANVNDMDLDLIKAEYDGADVKPTYLNINYGDRSLLDKAKQKLGLESDVYDIEQQPVSILNQRKYGLSPQVDINKSLNTYLQSVEKLESNKKIINEITHSFSIPLEEFGKVKKGYTIWSPDLIMQEIKEKGYAKADDIIQEYLKKDPEDIYRASTKAGLQMYQVPERVTKTLSNFYYTPKGVDKVLNKLNQPFKRYALATGRFIVNNTSNNLINNMIEGVPLDAYKIANKPELQNAFPVELQNVGFYGSEKSKSIPLVEKGINSVTNKILPFKKTQNLLTKGIDWIYDTNSNIENSIFRANYIKQIQDIAKKQGVGIDEIINNPMIQEMALENTYKSLGDYSTKQPMYNAPMWEDGVALTSVVPFARPFIEQSKVMAHQFTNRPLGFDAMVAKPAQVGSEIARNQEEEFNKNGRELKEYQKRAVYQGYYYDEDGHLQKEPDISKIPPKGKPVMYDSSSFLPHSIIGDYTEGNITELAGKLNPLVGLTVSTVSGNKFGEIPLTAPNRDWGQPMSEEDKASYLLSQVARTYTPAGTIEKMLPYRSYDSQLFIPDEKQRDKTPFYYSSRLLGGSEMVGSKLKSTKKSQKHKKSKKNKFKKGFKLDSKLPDGFELDK